MKQFLLCVALGAGFPALAAEMSADDVLARLHDANQEEIAVGKLAVQKAKSDKIRAYGNHLIKDHSKADEKVMKLAAQKQIDLSGSTPKSAGEAKQDAEAVSESTRLKTLSGADFDETFVKSMQADHGKLIGLLEGAQIQDPQVAALVKEILPQLKSHRMMAKNLIPTAQKEAQ